MQSTYLRVQGISKSIGRQVILHDIDLDVRRGEFVSIRGPSGAGKSTLLRIVAGLDDPDRGEIARDDVTFFSGERRLRRRVEDRDLGMVFQDYGLWPHLTVVEHVAFPLWRRRRRGLSRLSRQEIQHRAMETLRLFRMDELAHRRPHQLSGGQQQRLAVSRITAANPKVLLFDAPLSNLDPELRVSVRNHLKLVHGRLGATSLFVTHDQHEAMVLADRIAVMEHGRIAQIDYPNQLYRFPQTPFVAEFTGNPKTNLIRGEIHVSEGRLLLVPDVDPYCFVPLDKDFGELSNRKVIVHVRPEDLELVAAPGEDEGSLPVLAVMQDGPEAYVHLRFGEGIEQLIARTEPRGLAAFQRGARVGLRFRRGNVFDPETGTLAASFGYGRELAGGRL